MTMNVNQLTTAISELFGMPSKTAAIHSRVAREAGLLSQAGHGRGAAKASSADAAALTLTLLLCPSPARAAEFINDFGSLKVWQAFLDPQDGDALKSVAGNGTLLEGLANLIHALGEVEFARQIAKSCRKGPKDGGRNTPHERPDFRFEVNDKAMEASIFFGSNRLDYIWPVHADLGDEPPVEALLAAAREEKAMSRKYPEISSTPAIGSLKWLTTAGLIAIAEHVNGVPFWGLLDAAIQEEAGHVN
jgi:hypothetical protein